MYKDKPWLKFYDPHVPAQLDYPTTPIPAALDEIARRFPNRVALIFKGRQITYREYNAAADRFAAALQGLGLRKGDRVAIHMLNVPQFPIAYAAVLRAGGICVPCNPIYTPRELKHQLCDSGARIIVTLGMIYPRLQEIRHQTHLEHVIVAEIDTYLPPLLKFLYGLLKLKDPSKRASIAGHPHTYRFTTLLARAPAAPQPVELDLEDTAVLMYTGGTTGISKGAQLTHRNILANAYQVKVWTNATEKDSTLASLPLFHSYGMTCCMNTAAVTGGASILVPDPRDVKDILKSIHRYRPSFYPGVPALYLAVNNYPDVKKYDLSSIRACVSGAAALPREVQEKFQELTGARLVEGYGLSEATPVTHANPVFGESRSGIGVPYPDTECLIVDTDTGDEVLLPGEVGELCIRGPQVMKGYWNMPTESSNCLRDHRDGNGPWLHTGDIAMMDKDGYFRIVDRKKEMILGAGGFNVYPREIEDVLYEHPKVLEAAATGVLVGQGGQRVKAFVVLKPGETATAEEIIAFCRQNLAPYKVPKFVEFRPSLPKSLVGKILRRELAEAGGSGEQSASAEPSTQGVQ